MVKLTRRGLDMEVTDAEVEQWRREFQTRHLVGWPGLLGPDLDPLVQRRLSSATFGMRLDGSREVEHQVEDAVLLGLLQAILNDPALWRLVERVTGCHAIGAFTGRVYRREARPDGAHYFPWHSDTTGGRLVGFSLNLGTTPYEGGRLQIREADTERILADVANTGHGDALIFRIDPRLEHQVTPVTGPAPRTVLAGWFREGFDYWRAARTP